jgi:aminoglycoside 6'-N-acetyltransferase
VTLRGYEPGDRDAFERILAQPSVGRWWGAASAAEAADEWVEEDGESVGFAILLDGVVVGSIQYAEEDEAEYRHTGIDLFLDEAVQRRRLGPEAITVVARYLIEDRGHHRITIDPCAENDPAIRAYASVGFKPVGTLRAYQRLRDGAWHDGLLMDLLAAELRPFES